MPFGKRGPQGAAEASDGTGVSSVLALCPRARDALHRGPSPGIGPPEQRPQCPGHPQLHPRALLLHCKLPSLKMQRPSLLNCAETPQNRVQESKAEQGARGCWGVGAGTGTPAHVGAPVQTGLNWAGLLEPLPAAGNDIGFPAQELGPGLSHSGRGAQRSSCPLSGTQIWLIPLRGAGWGGFSSQRLGGEQQLAGVRGFGPLLATGSLSPSPLASRRWDVAVGLELPIAPSAAPRLCWGAHGGAQPWGHAMAFGEAPGTALGGCLSHIWRPLSINLPCRSILIYRFQPSVVGHTCKSRSTVLARPLGT